MSPVGASNGAGPHTPPDARVTVTIGGDAGSVTLRVADTANDPVWMNP